MLNISKFPKSIAGRTRRPRGPHAACVFETPVVHNIENNIDSFGAMISQKWRSLSLYRYLGTTPWLATWQQLKENGKTRSIAQEQFREFWQLL